MKIFAQFAVYIQSLNKKDFEKYLMIFLFCIAGLSGIITYYIYNTSSSLVDNMKALKEATKKTNAILKDNTKMNLEELRLQQLLEQDQNFNIKTFFEQFCSQYKIIPETGWDTITVPIEGNDQFDEVILSATFKNQTTQILTTILDAIDKKEIICIKELVIKNESNKKITFDIILATKKHKRSL